MPYRFIHAADIHLDSPLRSLALRDAELAELIGTATRRAFVGLVDLCLAERVDALLLSGDLYDGDQKSMKTARLVAEQFGRLHGAGIRVFVIRGNHDALSKIIQELTLPDSVKVFAGRAEAIAFDSAAGGLTVAVHGISFADPTAPESLLPKFRPPVESAINIGLLHTSLGGAPGHDVYAPCSEAELHTAGFRYWALGHIHKRTVAASGASTVVMPGMPQGRDINEGGPKSVSLVTVADDGTVTVAERLTSLAQFERATVDLGGVTDWRGALDQIESELARMRAAAPSEHLVVRLDLEGVTPLAWLMRRDADRLAEDIAHRAAGIGRTWIDKLAFGAIAPSPETAEASADAVTELARLIGTDVLPSERFQSEAETLAADLIHQLPPECRDLLGSDPAERAALLAELTREGVADVLAHLRAAPGEG